MPHSTSFRRNKERDGSKVEQRRQAHVSFSFGIIRVSIAVDVDVAVANTRHAVELNMHSSNQS